MIHTALRGLDAAGVRCLQATGLASMMIPLSEALYWAAVLDDALRDNEYERERQSDTTGCLIPGLRYARNFHTHQLIASAEIRGGLTVPFTVPISIPTYIAWRQLEDLPEPERTTRHTAAQQQSYKTYLCRRRSKMRP